METFNLFISLLSGRGGDSNNYQGFINPTNAHDDLDIESGLDEDGDKRVREARALLYYATYTSTTSSITYTGTSTLATLECTPSAYTLSACGK